MTGNVTRLKVWKRGQTAAEMLRVMADLAEETPEDFVHIVVMYTDGDNRFSYAEEGVTKTSQLIGLIECCKLDIIMDQR